MIEGVLNRASRFRVQGWAADLDDPDGVVEVVIKVNGAAIARIKADEPSEGLKKLGKYGEGRHVFTFGFNPPLASDQAQTIVVSAIGAKDPLRHGTAKLAPVPIEETRTRLDTYVPGPIMPVFVSFVGRSGSTLLMSKLAAHPEIIAGDVYPFEVQIAGHYAQCLEAQSALPDLVLKQGREDAVGPSLAISPRMEPAFKSHENLAYYFLDMYRPELIRTYRTLTSDYYRCMAYDAGKRARYFAEKLIVLPPRFRQRMLALYGATMKEIVIVRDLRDVLCSQAASHRQFIGIDSSTAELVTKLKNSARHLLGVLDPKTNRASLVVRYEDLVRDADAAMGPVFDFLGLPAPPAEAIPHDATGESALFQKHATSKSPAASIGRWQKDLSADEQALCGREFKDYLGRFAYA